MGKEKEKQAEMGQGRRMWRKEKTTVREEEGAVATAAGEQFFKVFFPKQSAEILKIPLPFHAYVEEAPNRLVSLKGPSGNTWKVKLTSVSQGLGFTEGWKEFARDHSLVPGQFLVFTYDGHSEFSVDVFSTKGVKDKAALKAKPHMELVVKFEEDEGLIDVDANTTPEAPVNFPVEGDGRSAMKRGRHMNDVMGSGTELKRQSNVQKKFEKRKLETTASNSVAAPIVLDSNKDAGSYHDMIDEISCINTTRMKLKNVSRMGNLVSKKVRQRTVISQRRLVTEEEKNKALRRAKDFKSTRHCFAMQVMLESDVYVGFFMNIPPEFVRKSLPRTNKKMILWDPLGKPWEVQYLYYDDGSVAAFSGGWGKFAIGNNLEKFDVCVFELFKEDNFKVHIYRVLLEITPLIRKLESSIPIVES